MFTLNITCSTANKIDERIFDILYYIQNTLFSSKDKCNFYITILMYIRKPTSFHSNKTFFSLQGFKATMAYENCLTQKENQTLANSTDTVCDFKTIISEVNFTMRADITILLRS